MKRLVLFLLKKERDSFIAYYILYISHLWKNNPFSFRLLLDSVSLLLGWLYFNTILQLVSQLNKLRETELFFSIRKWILNYFKLIDNYIIIPCPNNYNSLKEKKHFHLFTHYKLPNVSLISYHNIYLFISESYGVVFKPFKLKWKSIHGLWDFRSVNEIHPRYYRYIMDVYLRNKYLDKKYYTLPQSHKKYLLVHHEFNYYHWLTETWVRLWKIKDTQEEYVVLLPESLKKYSFVHSTLSTFEQLAIQWVPESTIIKARALEMMSMKRYWQHYNPVVLSNLRDHFRQFTGKLDIESPEKLFISRKKAVRRTFDNNEEIESTFRAKGFTVIHFEDYSFFEQVALMRNTNYLAGMHGAGLTNMIFMQNGGRVLEFHRSIGSSKDHHSIVYKNMSVCMQHEYFIHFCEPTNEEESFFTVNLKVNKAALEALLVLFLS